MSEAPTMSDIVDQLTVRIERLEDTGVKDEAIVLRIARDTIVDYAMREDRLLRLIDTIFGLVNDERKNGGTS